MTTGAAQAVAALVAVLSAQDEPIAATFADAMSRAVGCPRPECRNTQPPDAAVPTEDGWHIHYRCADCGLRWTEQESNMRSEVPGQRANALDIDPSEWENERAPEARIWRSAPEGSHHHNRYRRP